MAPRDHFTDHPRAEHLGIRLLKVCAFFAQGSAESIDNDDLTHGAFSVRTRSKEMIPRDTHRHA
jgi:hypothetical protein